MYNLTIIVQLTTPHQQLFHSEWARFHAQLIDSNIITTNSENCIT